MISFRYHIVSLVAVFLALALGIVVGTTALSGPITKDLRTQLNDTKKQRDALAGQVKTLQNNVDDAGQFAATYGSQLVAGTLTGQKVLLVALPDTSDTMQTGVQRQVDAAGAKITGIVTITKNYLDARLGDNIRSLAVGAARPIGITYPETSDAGRLGAALLSYVLLGKGQKTDLPQVLGGLSADHLVTVDGNAVAPATLVVVLGHGSPAKKDYAATTQLALVSALAQGGGHVVVAGDATSAAQGGVVASVRNAAGDRGSVSTVDDADNALGQVSTILALAAAAKGQVGHYGTGAGADALFPAPSK